MGGGTYTYGGGAVGARLLVVAANGCCCGCPGKAEMKGLYALGLYPGRLLELGLYIVKTTTKAPMLFVPFFFATTTQVEKSIQ
jgi:hypothetical protein